jgi:BAR domain.
MSQYVKWMGKRLESSEDKAYPIGYLGHMMVSHGEEFHPDSDFGNCLIAMGRANERISAIQESFVSEATSSWLESLERSLAMMKDYQARQIHACSYGLLDVSLTWCFYVIRLLERSLRAVVWPMTQASVDSRSLRKTTLSSRKNFALQKQSTMKPQRTLAVGCKISKTRKLTVFAT